jgi:hypothetical protein
MTVSRPDPGRILRRGLRGGGLLVTGALLTAAACAGGGPASEAGPGRDDATVVLRVRSPLASADLATLTQESDVAVHGTVEAIEPGVRIGPPGLTYSVFTIAVDDVLAGQASGTIQVAATTATDGHAVEVEGRPPLPEVGDDAVWFLNELAPEFGREGYVLSSPTGLVVMDGDTVATPEHTHDDEEPPALAEAAELGSEAAVLDHVRAVVE